MSQTLFHRALRTTMHARFVARADDLNRELTDEETVEEAKYLLDTIPYAGLEEKELKKALRELRALVRGRN